MCFELISSSVVGDSLESECRDSGMGRGCFGVCCRRNLTLVNNIPALYYVCDAGYGCFYSHLSDRVGSNGSLVGVWVGVKVVVGGWGG